MKDEMIIKKARSIAEYIVGRKICLVSHVHPDGDAVGSLLGFYIFLKKKGEDVEAVLRDGVPYQYAFLKGKEDIHRTLIQSDRDICVLLDASEFKRTGLEKPDIEIIRIDHHKTGERYSELDMVDTNAPATVSLVLEILRAWDESGIGYNVARALYTGLLTDTVSFLHANSFPWAFENAMYLSMRTKIDDIGSLVYERKRKSFYRLLVMALNRIVFMYNDSLAYTYIKNEDFAVAGASHEDTEGIVRHVISMDGVEVGVNFIEYERGIWKVSARGKGKVDLALLCQALGGGGHKNAAGCSIEGTLKEVISIFLEAFKEWAEYL